MHQKTAELGGMLRTGLEDSFYLPGGERAAGNGAMIEALAPARSARGDDRDAGPGPRDAGRRRGLPAIELRDAAEALVAARAAMSGAGRVLA